MIRLAISTFLAGSAGMPSWSQVRPTTSQGVPAMSGKIVSHLSPSSLTELTMPGLLRWPSSMTRAKSFALGESMHSGTLVAPCIKPISQTIVSYSISVAVLGAQSRKFAPALACAKVRSIISASFFSEIACLIDGIAPLIFSPMMIIPAPLNRQ